MSISPDARAVKRCFDESGVYFTLDASPKTAAATPRHTSTSMPVQLPASSAFEKPGRPWLKPHCTKPLAFTALSVASTDAVSVFSAAGAGAGASFFVIVLPK